MEDSRRNAIDQLLRNNFDAVSTTCIVTITKYVTNIANNPAEPKYRTINTSNKAFVEKVLPAKGAMELMESLGFLPTGDNNLHSSASAMFMSENFHLLEEVLVKLNVPAGERPKPMPKVPAASTAVPVPPFDFDPYQTSIVRTAPQPARGVSSTEAQLETLSKRRRELEGTLESVDRATQLLLPRDDGSTPSMQEFIDDGQQEGNRKSSSSSSSSSSNSSSSSSSSNSSSSMEVTESSESTVIARSLASQIKNAGVEEPLTTKAVRDLRQAQKERVYCRTLVRVKFPDRVCIQGYFHPRHTVLDVYEWVRVCLRSDMSEGVTSSSSSSSGTKSASAAGKVRGSAPVPSGAPDYLTSFELYTSPPKMVLHPYALSPATEQQPTPQQQPPQYLSLADLRFVPAILMHCSWSPTVALTVAAAAAATDAGEVQVQVPAGRYLSTALRQQAQTRTLTGESEASYPQGAALVAASNSGAEANGAAEGKTAAAGAGTGTDAAASTKPKPKWLKI